MQFPFTKKWRQINIFVSVTNTLDIGRKGEIDYLLDFENKGYNMILTFHIMCFNWMSWSLEREPWFNSEATSEEKRNCGCGFCIQF